MVHLELRLLVELMDLQDLAEAQDHQLQVGHLLHLVQALLLEAVVLMVVQDPQEHQVLLVLVLVQEQVEQVAVQEQVV